MATLTIRDLDESVKTKLRVRAARNGRSMEAEAREILANTLKRTKPAQGLGTYIHEMFAEIGFAEDLVLPSRNEPVRFVDFSAPDFDE